VRNPGETLTGQAFVRVSWGGGAELPTDTNNPDQIMDWLDARGILQAVRPSNRNTIRVFSSHAYLLLRNGEISSP